VVFVYASLQFPLLSVDHFAVELVRRHFQIGLDLLDRHVQVFLDVGQVLQFDRYQNSNHRRRANLRFVVPDAAAFLLHQVGVPTVASSTLAPLAVVPNLEHCPKSLTHNDGFLTFSGTELTRLMARPIRSALPTLPILCT
jgi:hypothetical protein